MHSEEGAGDQLEKAHETPKKVFIKTFGCQMNVYDSERMMGIAASEGYSETSSAEEADLIILNTCHIREKAAEKLYSELGRMRVVRDERRKNGRDSVIAVAGCVAQAEGEEIFKRAPAVDIVVGPQSYHRMPALLKQRQETQKSVLETEFPAAAKFQQATKPLQRASATSFLTVQEGCNKFCTFCVVPYTRGAEYSRPISQIIEEAKIIIDQGTKEITLLGQNVNGYCGKSQDGRTASLADLLIMISELSGLERIRYTTSHPSDMSADLIEAHRSLPKLMPYLHLPFQAGSDRILKAMNRRHTISYYLDIIAQLRVARPDLALSTDIIVGFPGETDEDFEATLEVVNRVQFAQAYSFKYSERPGTPAADILNQVSDHIKHERLLRLQALLKEQQNAFNTQLIGKTIDVLWEYQGKAPGLIVGRSPYLQPVHAAGPVSLIGSITAAHVVSASPNALTAVINMGETPVISKS